MSDANNISPKVAAQLQRILVVDPNPATTKMLAELLRSLLPKCEVRAAQTDEQAYVLLERFDPLLIFVELKGPRLDGLAFTQLLRRSYLSCREAAVIITTAEATAAAITGARDAGVHEFLRRPFNLGDLKKRFDAIAVRPRDWIEAINYVGPDRRRFNSADYKGPRKRRSEGASPVIKQIGQAIRIVQSAASATSSDPKQALRALKAQMRILIRLCGGDEALRSLQAAALAFEDYLLDCTQVGGLSKDKVEAFAAQLILATPVEASERAA